MQIPVAYIYDTYGYLTHIRVANSDTGKCRNVALDRFLYQNYIKDGFESFVGTYPLSVMQGIELVEERLQVLDHSTLQQKGYVVVNAPNLESISLTQCDSVVRVEVASAPNIKKISIHTISPSNEFYVAVPYDIPQPVIIESTGLRPTHINDLSGKAVVRQ